MIVFVYLQSKKFDEQLRRNFKGHIIINAKISFKNIMNFIKSKKNYVLVNFYKSQYEFEFIITQLTKKIVFFYLSSSNTVNTLPEYARNNVITISRNFEQISKHLNNPPKLKIQCHYLWNQSISVIEKNNSLYNNNQLAFNFKPKSKDSDYFFRFNTGKLCYLMTMPNCDFLVLYDKNSNVLYRVVDSDKEGTKQFFFKEMVSACETIIVGSVTINREIITFTFIGVKETQSFKVKDYIKFFISSMKEIDTKSEIKMNVKETDVYYQQMYNNFHFVVPKVLSIFDKIKDVGKFTKTMFL